MNHGTRDLSTSGNFIVFDNKSNNLVFSKNQQKAANFLKNNASAVLQFESQ